MWAVLLITFSLCFANNTRVISKLNYEKLWIDHKNKYSLKFVENQEEIKKMVFIKNMQYIEDHNYKNTDFKLEANEFTHMEPHEMQYGYVKYGDRSLNTPIVLKEKYSTLPVRYQTDYRSFGVIQPVQNQLKCGSCWAFSSVAAIESHLALMTGQYVKLSEQDVKNCASRLGNNGCHGGYPALAFEHVRRYGIALNERYPYDISNSTCLIKENKLMPLEGWEFLPEDDEQELVRALSFIGPITIGINASHPAFRFYKSGVFKVSNCFSAGVNHAVLAVGYVLGSDPYIIVRNSWGTKWGDDGIKLALFHNNMCGIASEAIYPLIRQPNKALTFD